MKELHKIAKDLGIENYLSMDKLNLVKAIQKAESNFPCFGTADVFCDQYSCLFRKDCLNKNY